MKFRANLAALPIWLVVGCLTATGGLVARAKDVKLEALLVWATNAEKSPNPKHKPVEPEVRKKLCELPLKWKNYFEENRKEFSVAEGEESKRVVLSSECTLKVKYLGKDQFEVSLIGKGKPVFTRTQPLLKGKMLVAGGNAPDSTGWLVVLKRIE